MAVFCRCDDDVCPHHPKCTCIGVFVSSEGVVRCNCACSDFIVPLHLKAEDQINLSVRNNELGAVAEFVHKVTGTDVLIPVSALRTRVNVNLEDVPFADALKELGLALAPSQDSGTYQSAPPQED